jgi:hypothetical protein
MKTFTTLLLFLILLSQSTYSQRILLSQNFENGPYTADSLPLKWVKFKVNGPGQCTNPPLADWRIRDSGKAFCGVNANPSYTSKAYSSLKSLSIPMTASTGSVTDDWVFTDSLNIITGDSLKFWIQLGTYPAGGQYFFDSLQIWITTAASPTGGTRTRIATVISLPMSQNTWQYKTYNLSAFNGQKVYAGFRYNMNTSANGLRVNLDDIFVGNLSAVGIGTQNEPGIPTAFELKQNYRNPFNPETIISYQLPVSSNVTLSVYDITGREVEVLVNEFRTAGTHEITFDASNLPSGIYIYKMISGDFTATRKMSLLK